MSTQEAPLQSEQLDAYYKSEEERRAFVRETFNKAASGYDHAEALTSLGSGAWFRRQVLTRCGLKQGMEILDVACGTGLVSREAIKIVGDPKLVTGLDPTPGMLAEAQKALDINTVEAFAEDMPLEDNRFDFLSMGYALRHVSDLDKTFSEYHRVLKPSGVACIMEITCPKKGLGRWLVKQYIRRIVPLLAILMRRRSDVAYLWEFYWDTIQACVPPETVMESMRKAGFQDVKRHVVLGIFTEYTGVKEKQD